MDYKRSILLGFLVAGTFSCVDAVAQNEVQPLLNKISYQMNAEQWATTATANATISLDAALDKIGLANLNNYVLKNVNAIAPSKDWHITEFSRNQDKSGLENVHIEAQARLATADLAGLREKAKNISKSGETYTISAIDFSPSNEEMENAHLLARSVIYDKAKNEIARLNQVYPDQHFFLYSIDFSPSAPPQMPYAKVEMATTAVPEAAAPMVVNAKIVEQAAVVLASPTANAPQSAQR